MTDQPHAAQDAIDRFADDYRRVREQVARVIVGHDAVVDGVLTCLFTGGHALLEGVPGIGKTLLIRTLSQALNLSFGRIQFTPDLMPADITGTTVLAERDGDDGAKIREFRFQPGPIFAQIVLADEINRATPKTQAAMLEAMQERSVTVSGETHVLDRPFFVMATQNPIEQEGTYPLPEAELDRFFYKLTVGYSSREELSTILDRTTAGGEVTVEPVLDADQILAHQALVQRIAIAPHVQDFAVRTVMATHPNGEFATPTVNKYVRFGASPRGAQSLVLAGKCRSMLEGRPSVSIDDLRAVALAALRHRVALNFEGEAEGVSSDDIIDGIVRTLPVGEGVA